MGDSDPVKDVRVIRLASNQSTIVRNARKPFSRLNGGFA